MRVSLRWLEEFVPVDVPVERLVDMLDLSGTKVESVERPGQGTDGVIVAEVLNIEKHPNADTLSLVDITVDGDETMRVVCGASNFKVGERVPYAGVGARLPEMEITERKIRGQVSRGMLCSGAELGISKDHSGILVLPPDTPLGQDIVTALGLDDTILELEITPNRPDCMSMLGIAREVSALLGHGLKWPDTSPRVTEGVASPVRVEIEDTGGCPRYLARYIEDLKIGPSPSWMTTRLVAAGVRPISNVVDVTNYVLLELGHPLHAFDAAKVAEKTIVVRRAHRGERLNTLDGTERELDPADLLIADRRRALALAGVMGGIDSEVSDETTGVILESAYFDPATVARTSQRHLLRTEASARFQRGMDPEIVPVAAARAAGLMAELAGGKVSPQEVDAYLAPQPPKRLTLRPSRVGQLLGAPVDADHQVRVLNSLEIPSTLTNGVIGSEVPSFRPDLRREVDLIEEVARITGFERLPATLPPGRTGGLELDQRLDRFVRTTLAGFGLFEAWTQSFVSAKSLGALGLASDHPARTVVRIDNPMTEDQEALRTTLIPGLLRSMARNVAFRSPGVALFELARVYEPVPGESLPREGVVIAAAMTGERMLPSWNHPPEIWTFFAAKGVIESLVEATGASQPTFAPVTGMPFHPTRAAQISIAGRPCGTLGQLHPDAADAFEVPEVTLVFELALAPLIAALPERRDVGELPRFPANHIDMAVVVDEDTPAGSVQSLIEEAGRPELQSVRLFDLYRGDQVAAGKKSLAFALELQAPDRTLTDAEAMAVRDRIMAVLKERTGADLR